MKKQVIVLMVSWGLTLSATGQQDMSKPDARGRAHLIYHPSGKAILLFDGYVNHTDSTQNDVWKWDGAKWSLVKAYGGWDGKQMKKIAMNGPTEFGVALGYDAVRKVIVAYGGYGSQRTAMSALWELKNGTWKKISNNGVWKQVRRDKYEWLDPSVDISIPEGRWAHHMTYDEANNRVLLYGGSHGAQILGDMWAWNGLSWEELSLGGPPARNKGIFVYDPNRKKAILFGGANSEDKNIGDTWEWDGKDWNEVKGNGPAVRVHGLGVFDKSNNVVLIFGGFGSTGVLHDTWAFDGKDWKPLNADGPANCLPHGMMYDRTRKAVVMITVALEPDSSTGKPKNEMWEWKDTGWKKLEIAVPSITGLQSFASFGNNDLILFDGNDMPGNKGTTWKYSAGRWQIVSRSGPGIRMGFVMAYDTKRKKIVLFGGGKANSSKRYNDTWEWDGNEWKKMK